MVKDPIKGAILGTGSGLKAKDIHTYMTYIIRDELNTRDRRIKIGESKE